jgi:RND family efflux transporter MFP subunit
MTATKGSVILKLLVVLALAAAGVFAALFASRGDAPDGVPGSVVVHADKGLQDLRIEAGGRVTEIGGSASPAEGGAPAKPGDVLTPLESGGRASDAEGRQLVIDRGTTFKKGDVLMRLDTTELKHARAEIERAWAEAQEKAKIAAEGSSELAEAERNLTNTKRWHELGVASEDDLIKAQQAVTAVKTKLALETFGLRQAEAIYKSQITANDIALSKMVLEAPADGMVEAVMVAPGALINPGATVMTYYRNERVVIARISEEDFAKVKLGDPAKVRLITYPNLEFDAKVSRILPFADAETRRYEIYLDVQAKLEQLRPNSTGEATITTGIHKGVPLVPRRAIFNGNFIFVVNGGRIEQRQIELGFRGLYKAEVAKGLKPGELVVVENQDQFRNGQRVRIAPAAAQ